MQFKPGDKVKFISQIGGGVVTKILSPMMVNVAIEDGFEIPTLTSDLIKVSETDNSVSSIHTKTKPEIQHSEITESDLPERKMDLHKAIVSQNALSAGIYLAYVPQDQRWLFSGKLDVYLVNYTDYHILYSFFLKGEKEINYGMDFDAVEPRQKILIESIDREEIDEWNHGVIQVLFHKDELSWIPLPLNAEFKVKSTRFLKEDNYIRPDFLREKALIVTLGKASETSMNRTLINDKSEELSVKEEKATSFKPETILTKHLINEETAEVDLHIGELATDYYMLEPSEMLNLQLEYAQKCLEAAIAGGIKKIIFIHGVGIGTLKREMSKLFSNYSGLHAFDASIAKYGTGATEVFISQNTK